MINFGTVPVLFKAQNTLINIVIFVNNDLLLKKMSHKRVCCGEGGGTRCRIYVRPVAEM